MSYLLDTNILSEMRYLSQGRGDLSVRNWLVQHDPDTFFLSSLTIFETEYGIRLMERRDPKQGAVLRDWMETSVMPTFTNRILLVNAEIARIAANLQVPDRRPFADCFIAATALHLGLTIITRNVADFQGLPLSILNPWLT